MAAGKCDGFVENTRTLGEVYVADRLRSRSLEETGGGCHRCGAWFVNVEKRACERMEP
jgi:hypothetical protein